MHWKKCSISISSAYNQIQSNCRPMVNIFKMVDNFKFFFNKILWTWSNMGVILFSYLFGKLCFGGCFILRHLESEALVISDTYTWKLNEHAMHCSEIKAAGSNWKQFFTSGSPFCIQMKIQGESLMSITNLLKYVSLRYKTFYTYFSL